METTTVWCASKAEKLRGEQLLELQRQGRIDRLQHQPSFELIVNGFRVGRYTPDWRYIDTATSELMTEEVKGIVTADYVLRAKLFLALHRDPLFQLTDIPSWAGRIPEMSMRLSTTQAGQLRCRPRRKKT